MAYRKRNLTGYSMSGGKRTSKTYKSTRIKRRPGPKRRMNIPQMVDKILARKIETKTSTSTVTDGIEILHNNFVVLDPTANFLRTTSSFSFVSLEIITQTPLFMYSLLTLTLSVLEVQTPTPPHLLRRHSLNPR
jgi:hypothetical protein